MTTTVLDVDLDVTELTVDEPTCQAAWCFRDKRTGELVDITEECGAPATHQVLRTCCGGIRYYCAEHVEPGLDPFGRHATGMECACCSHRCYHGVCDHRVVMAR